MQCRFLRHGCSLDGVDDLSRNRGTNCSILRSFVRLGNSQRGADSDSKLPLIPGPGYPSGGPGPLDRAVLRSATRYSRTMKPSHSEPPTGLERIRTVIVDDHDDLGRLVARRIAEVIRSEAAAGEPAVLGLATGSTPIGVYRELIRMHREEGLSFAKVVTFNLDEYYPMDPGSIHSYHRFMWENLFSHLDIPRRTSTSPAATCPRDEVEAECARYEAAIRAAGGIDIQILGIGQTGHIGFNEPGSGAESRTRLVHPRPGDPQGRRRGFLRRGERPPRSDHDGRRDDPRGPRDR